MGLGLDLNSPVAKVAQACVHYKTFEREFHRLVEQYNPHAVLRSEVKPGGGATAYVVALPTEKNLLGLIAGDVIHNLRCALDYIVSALAKASSIGITSRH